MRRAVFGGAALLTALAAGSSQAASTADLQHCRGIGDDVARLRCYDALVPAAAAATAPAPAPAPAPVMPIEPAAAVAPVAAAPAARAADFGAETLRRKPAADDQPQEQALHARIVGHVETVKKGTRYKLDNGQIWQSIDDREVLLDLDSPAVTIERNFIGSYFLQPDARNTRIRVRRIQ